MSSWNEWIRRLTNESVCISWVNIMLIQDTLSEIMGRMTSEMVQAIKAATTPSNASTESVQIEPVEAATDAAKRPNGQDIVPVAPPTPLSFRGEQKGVLVISEPTTEESQILKDYFGLAPDFLKEAGLQAVHFVPKKGENLGQYSDGMPITLAKALPAKASYDTPAHQWGEYSFSYLPTIPCGESLRLPLHNKSGKKVGHTYHRIVQGWGGTNHKIVTYQGPRAQRQATFLPCNAQLLADPEVPLVCVENAFQALNVHQNGGAVISLNGSLRHGFSAQGHFAPCGIEEVRQRMWTPEDAAALFEMLGLDQIPFKSTGGSDHGSRREAVILCELGWLRKEFLEMAVPLLQQVIALHNHLQGLGACSRVLTAPITGPENSEVEVPLDHMLGAGEWRMSDLTAYNGYPGFHSAM